MEKIIYRKTLDVHKNGIQFTLQGFETADKLSRRIEINLTASGDTYELPLEGVVALMYITTPSAEEPSIEECTIKDNTVVYDVLPIVEEGITEMQLKLIGTNYDGAKAVLVAPRFAVEVLESEATDDSAEQTTTFTALENAVAKVSAIYDTRLVRVEFDEACTFKAYYANGYVYENNNVALMLTEIATGMDLTQLMEKVLAYLDADAVADVLDARYRDLLACAKDVNNIAATFEKPTFVAWTKNGTENIPNTTAERGFGLVVGDALTEHTAVLWTNEGEAFVRKTIGGVTEWTSCLTNKGGTVNGNLNIVKEDQKPEITFEDKGGILVGKVSRDEQGTMLVEAKDTSGASNGIKVTTSADANKGFVYTHTAEGETKDYKLYGEHNMPYPAQIYSGSYKGTETEGGKDSVVIKSPFPIKMVVLVGGGTMIAVYGRTSANSMGPEAGMTVGWSKLSWGDKTMTITSHNDKWNNSAKTYDYIIFG